MGRRVVRRVRVLVLVLGVGLAAPAAAQDQGWRAHLDALAEAVRLHPDDHEVVLRLAAGHAAHGELDEALTWARTAEKLGAHALRARLVQGDAYLNAGRPSEAIDRYLEVVEAAPDNAYSKVQLWRALRDAVIAGGDTSPGSELAAVRERLSKSGYFLPLPLPRPRRPADAERIAGEARKAMYAGDFGAAVDRFHDALAADDRCLPALEGLGEALLRSAREREAHGAFWLYVSLSPREDRTTRRLRRLLYDVERRRALGGRPRLVR